MHKTREMWISQVDVESWERLHNKHHEYKKSRRIAKMERFGSRVSLREEEGVEIHKKKANSSKITHLLYMFFQFFQKKMKIGHHLYKLIYNHIYDNTIPFSTLAVSMIR